MSLTDSRLIYPMWFFGLLLLSLILVPRKDYAVLIFHGFIGSFTAWVFFYFASKQFKVWTYILAEPFLVSGFPVFILGAWGVTMIIFLWALPLASPRWVHYIYIACFALTGGLIDDLFNQLGLRPHSPWYKWWMAVPAIFLVFGANYLIYLNHLSLPRKD